jgi:hypothetical protein
MYRLDNKFASGHFTLTVVGCGGTGGFTAEGLCRLLPQQAALILVDHDRVEERNLTRQCFIKEDLGKFKSEVLARRLAQKFNRSVGYSTLPVAMVEIPFPGLVIGCVDNGLSRRDIAEKVKSHLYALYGFTSWWIDAGNGENYGQVLIGNTGIAAAFTPEGDIYHGLPLPTLQRPDLLLQVPRGRDCTVIAEEQGPTINLTMAAVVVEVVHRLIAGTCPWVQLYLDMEAGTLTPVLATPESIKSITRIKKRKNERR